MQKYWVTVGDVGNIHWYKDAKRTILHRVGGPAAEWANGTKEWYMDNKWHRTDGPAIEWADGDKWWFLNGKRITQEEHLRRINPAQEMTVADIEAALGKRIKIVK